MKNPLAQWFKRQKWKPFPFQEQTWAAYLGGESGLVHAPTGLGKTYAVWGGPLLEWLRENPDETHWPKKPSRFTCFGSLHCARLPTTQ